MTVSADRWRCDKCQTEFRYGGPPEDALCIACGAKYLTRFIEVHETISLHLAEHVRLVAKDPTRPSSEKRRLELRKGRRLEGSGSGRLVDEVRIIDRDSDHYKEHITDAETGQILRDIEEALSTHRGGTMKDRRK